MQTSRMALVPLVVLFVGCAQPKVLTVGPLMPPTNPGDVEQLLDPPDRPYRTIGLIRSTARGAVEDQKAEVIREAAKIGAVAVILSFGSAGGSSGHAISSGENTTVTVQSSDTFHVIGRAIVYERGG